MEIFVDTDIVISSLLSSTGASYQLLHNKDFKPFVSSISSQEIKRVASELKIPISVYTALEKEQLKVVKIQHSEVEIKAAYEAYVSDREDAHIVAGAEKANAQFLITYNIKDFKTEKIKQDFNIIVIKPGKFLQYLRSL